MTKVLKILLKILGGTFEWLLILIILLSFAIRTSTFQTFIADRATSYFSKELKTTIKIDKLDIISFNKVILDGFLILDLNKDTLASIGSVKVTLQSLNLEKNAIVIKEAYLSKGNISINQDKMKGKFNFQFISDYFSSTDTTSKSKPFQLKIKSVRVAQLNFKFDDYRQAFLPFGIDYSHLNIKNLYLNTTIDLNKDGGIEAKVKHLSLYDKSGFEIDKFSAKILFNEKGLKMNYFRIYTPNSKIYFHKLNLLTESTADFSEFIDKVVFDINLKESLISLKDVSYFVTDMEGMDQNIYLQTQISKRVKDLKLSDLELKTGENTKIKGNVNLPDFRVLEQTTYNENIEFAHISLKDIEAIKLPKSNKEKYLKLDKTIKNFEFIDIKDLNVNGVYSKFILKSDYIASKLGTLELDNGILIKENKKRNSFTFEKTLNSEFNVKIDSFLLGKFLNDKNIGSLTGNFLLAGEVFSSGKLDFNEIKGQINKFSYQNYNYKLIDIENATFVNNIFDGKINVEDENIKLTYDGFLDLNKKQHFNFSVDVEEAVLDKLHFSKIENNVFKSSISVDISGTKLSNYSGKIDINNLFYQEGKNKFNIPSMQITMNRSSSLDELEIRSNIIDVNFKGKIDFETVAIEINNQFDKVLPALFTAKELNPKKTKNQFDYQIRFKDIKDILNVFVPELAIAKNTTIKGKYDGNMNLFDFNLGSDRVSYEDIVVSNIIMAQKINGNELQANYTFGKMQLTDSISLENITFKASGTNDEIDSDIIWNVNTPNETHFSWKTIVNDLNSYFFNINPSYFAVKNHRWDIFNNSQVLLSPHDIQIQNFKMQRENQYLTIDGCISEHDQDALKIDIKDLELNDFSNLLGLQMDIKGNVNGVATISDPFQDLYFTSDVQIKELFLDGAEVGDINVKGNWGKETESIDLAGELFYKKNKTFGFTGNYYLNRKDNLNFNLNFDHTDLQFTNAFMDPQVLSGIRGLVSGNVKINGSTENPIILGDINLMGGNAKVEMFGVNFGFNGKIKIEQDGIFIDNMPVMDEDGNSGTLVATIFHTNFADWNFDIAFDLTEDAYNRRQALPRFLVMNTKYKEGEIYYGKAYVTGNANIFGYADNMFITVNLETQKGTQINFPMYGASELSEDQFITFKSKDTNEVILPKINYSGVNLALNFKVTPNAQLKIIFDENTGDEITAFGQGNIAMKMDNVGDIFMNGVFEITKGSVYNFVMGPVKQPFFIEEGGTISWTGDPINAILDLKTYNVVKTTLSDIMPTIEEGTIYPVQDVKCYLNLSQTLMEPLIQFDIEVPKATENDKAALNRIKGDKDELNKQFFSLLLVKKFQPIQGALSGGAGAGLDLVSGQLNDMLNKVSNDVKFNVALSNSKEEKSAALGVQKNLLDNRLILKGSFGVENTSASPSSFIGDVNVEYLINEKGTFRASIFNESNDNTVIQEKSQGQFTQGAGVNYQEDFNSIEDFQMVQYFLDLFRSQETKRYPIKKRKKRKEVPSTSKINSDVNKPEE
jgi:hypothetical protein